MITSSNIVEFFELYLRPFLEQESRLTKELAADEAIAVYDDPVAVSYTHLTLPTTSRV